MENRTTRKGMPMHNPSTPLAAPPQPGEQSDMVYAVTMVDDALADTELAVQDLTERLSPILGECSPTCQEHADPTFGAELPTVIARQGARVRRLYDKVCEIRARLCL